MGGHPLPRFVLGILHGEQMAEAQSIGHVQQRREVLRVRNRPRSAPPFGEGRDSPPARQLGTCQV